MRCRFTKQMSILEALSAGSRRARGLRAPRHGVLPVHRGPVRVHRGGRHPPPSRSRPWSPSSTGSPSPRRTRGIARDLTSPSRHRYRGRHRRPPGDRQVAGKAARATYGVVGMQESPVNKLTRYFRGTSPRASRSRWAGQRATSASTSSWSAASTSPRSPPTCGTGPLSGRAGRRRTGRPHQRARRGPPGLSVRTAARCHRVRSGGP